MFYILDTNVISDLIVNYQPTTTRFNMIILDYNHDIGLCQPVYYELKRGLLRREATRKTVVLDNNIAPRLTKIDLIDEDWLRAGQFWAETTSKGQQLSDMDLLIAALAYRLDAIVVSNDADFDALPIPRENWRNSS